MGKGQRIFAEHVLPQTVAHQEAENRVLQRCMGLGAHCHAHTFAAFVYAIRARREPHERNGDNFSLPSFPALGRIDVVAH